MDASGAGERNDSLAPAPPPRWGLGDFVWVYLAGIAASVFLGAIGVGISGDRGSHVGALTTALSALGQFGGWFVAIAFVARVKGVSLRRDFGFTLRTSSWWAIFAGLGLFVVGTIIIVPLHALVNESQKVVDDLEHASGAKLVVLALLAGIVAPVCEELLFRGVLLRSLRRKMTPALAIGLQALVFALAHPLLSPTLGDLVPVPALFLLGSVSGIAAEVTGDLSASILMHVGFNLVTTLLVL